MSSSAIVTPTIGALSHSPLGFCQRCGDPIFGKARCSKCSGSSLRSTTVLPAAKKPDPWAHRYVHGDSSFQSAFKGEKDDEEYLHNHPPPQSPKRASFDPALGFGMPSRISRDLRTSSSSKSVFGGDPNVPASLVDLSSSNLNLPFAESACRHASQDYSAPIIKGSDGGLSKVCGSLVEPSESRNRWACAGCASVFARDSTLYAAPPSQQSLDSSYYCRDCYAARYSLGSCRACSRDVLGSTKDDGKYVKASSGIWHGRCWKCTSCCKGGADGVEILIGMDGNPTCEGCFDRPQRTPSTGPPPAHRDREGAGLPDMRRVTRTGAARTGPMGATIAELTKKLGQQPVSSASRLPLSSLANSNTSVSKSISLRSSVDAPPSPIQEGCAFPVQAATSSGSASSTTRSERLYGSPSKPLPLTAPCSDGVNLADTKPFLRVDTDGERLTQTGSRTRSTSPAKRSEWTSSTSTFEQKPTLDRPERDSNHSCSRGPAREDTSTATGRGSTVPGSPSPHPIIASSSRLDVASQDPGRRRTLSGFLRPLHVSISGKQADEQKILQDQKGGLEESPLPSSDGLKSPLEPPQGTVRCAACGLLLFERSGTTQTQDVVMVTLADQVHLHADCFRCSICHELIDGTKTFVRVPKDAAHTVLGSKLAGYAHPRCSPTVQLKVIQTQESTKTAGVRSYRTSLDPTITVSTIRDGSATSHATHQRELKASSVPSPAMKMRDRRANDISRPTGLPQATPSDRSSVTKSVTQGSSASKPSGVSRPTNASTSTPAARLYQPTNGAASLTQAVTLTPAPVTGPVNPAAGIFSRMNALSAASNNPTLLVPSSSQKFGGMQHCAYCGLKLSMLESVLGPRGTQWHKTCLICRAPPPAPPKESLYSWRKQAPTMCGKRLDSGAKVNKDGEVRCRECYDRESSVFRIKV